MSTELFLSESPNVSATANELLRKLKTTLEAIKDLETHERVVNSNLCHLTRLIPNPLKSLKGYAQSADSSACTVGEKTNLIECKVEHTIAIATHLIEQLGTPASTSTTKQMQSRKRKRSEREEVEKKDEGDTGAASPTKKPRVSSHAYFIFGAWPGEEATGFIFEPSTPIGYDIAELIRTCNDRIANELRSYLHLRNSPASKMEAEDRQELRRICREYASDIKGLSPTCEIGTITNWTCGDTVPPSVSVWVPFEY